MDWIKIKSKRYPVATKSAELKLQQVKRIVNLKRPDEFETDEGLKKYLDYIRQVLHHCSGADLSILNRINDSMVIGLYNLVSDLVNELETFNFQEHITGISGYKLPEAIWMGGQYVYGYGITAKTYSEASDIISVNNAALLGLLPGIYSGINDPDIVKSYHEGDMIFGVAIEFFKIHLNIANRIQSKYPVLSEKGDKTETVKGYGSKGLLYEVAASGIATLKEVEAMDVLDFFDVLAYLRTVNKQIKQKFG